MNNLARRLGASLALGALASTVLVAGATGTAHADGSTPVSPSAQAALAWLDTQYVGLGQKVDLYLGLDVIGDGAERQAAIAQELRDSVSTYVQSDYNYDSDGDGTPEHYTGTSSGALAKTLTVAAAAGDPVEAYGGDEVSPKLDLVAMLGERMIDDGPSAGRLEDYAEKDGEPDPASNYANSFGQAYAVRGLAAADTPAADALLPAVQSFLLDQQCEAGFFRLYFNVDPTAPNQGCDNAAPAEETAQADTTAMVLITLNDLADEDPEVAAALDRAEEWLAGQQLPDGSFPGGEDTEGPNSNTVGLSGWALGLRGDDERAAAAATWLRARQLTGAACDGAAASHRGAIAFTDDSLVDGLAYGIDDITWEWAGATVQAAPALAWAPAGNVSAKAPTFARAGKQVKVTVTGAADGERLCVVGGKAPATLIGDGTVKVALGKKDAVVEVRGLDTTTPATVVLAKKKLKPALKKVVKRGQKQQVKVKGLAAGEKVKVKLGKTKVVTGKANAKGVFKKKFKVTAKKGKAKVTVTGQFANRTGSKKFTVK